MESFDFSSLLDIMLTLVASLVCITLHELSHGYVAWKLGDNTAKNAGRLTLNPFKHIDLVGFIMMLVLKIGWAKPVPVNFNNLNKPKRDMAITAFAGPLSNVIITVICLFLYGALLIPFSANGVGLYFLKLFERTAYMSLGFAVFNMLPFPPLDGSKLMYSVLKDEHYAKVMDYEGYGSVILIILTLTGFLGTLVAVVRQLLYNDLMPVAQWAYETVAYLFYI